jgi:PleD family two-component response regulator
MTAKELIQESDTLLYVAKNSGRNQIALQDVSIEA